MKNINSIATLYSYKTNYCDYDNFVRENYVLIWHKPKVFQKRLLKRTSGPGRIEATGGQRNEHNEELYNLYTSTILGC
jgi:hypothetical protein